MAGAELQDFDLYDALDLQRTASTEEVRAAFRDLSRIYHPDKRVGQTRSADGSDGPGGEDAFRQLANVLEPQ